MYWKQNTKHASYYAVDRDRISNGKGELENESNEDKTATMKCVRVVLCQRSYNLVAFSFV